MRPVVRDKTWIRVAMVLAGVAVAVLVGCQFAMAALDQPQLSSPGSPCPLAPSAPSALRCVPGGCMRELSSDQLLPIEAGDHVETEVYSWSATPALFLHYGWSTAAEELRCFSNNFILRVSLPDTFPALRHID